MRNLSLENAVKEGFFPILRTGKFRDSKGRLHDFTIDRLQKIAANYNPENADFKEAPLVISHNIDEKAQGWIEKLVTKGNYLLAKPKQVAKTFYKDLTDHVYKYVSASVRPDNTLKSLAFVRTPAVGGLGAVPVEAFVNFGENRSEEDIELSFDFAEIDIDAVNDKFRSISSVFAFIRDFLISIAGVDSINKIVDSYTIDFIKDYSITKPEVVQDANLNFSESAGNPGKEEIKMKGFKKKPIEGSPGSGNPEKEGTDDADFSEAYETERKRADALEIENARLKTKEREKEAFDFCEGLVPGVLIPKHRNGIQKLISELDEVEENFEFSEGSGTVQKRPVEIIKAFLKEIKPQIPLDALPTQKNELAADFSEGDYDEDDLKVHKTALAIQNTEKIDYHEALKKARRN